MHEAAVHGGDVWKVAADYDIPVSSLLDFSANINPRGLPPVAMERLRQDANNSALLAKYPDPSYAELRHALAKRDGVSPDAILIGEGAEALIGATLRGIKPVRCLLPIPAFGEYARACASAGTQVETLQLDWRNHFAFDESAYTAQLRSASCDCAILNNPHNPSGTLLSKQAVIALIERIRAAGAFVLLDEAFIDYAPDETVISYASKRAGVVVIRSLTKFFGCPALRVGYAVGMPETLRAIARFLPTWPVTTFAANALETAVRDRAYAEKSLRTNQEERDKLAQSLRDLGAHVIPSATNFLLIRLREEWPDSSVTREYLIRHHRILVRNCDSFTGLEKGRYIRVAVRTARDNKMLVEGLRKLWQSPKLQTN